jgi:hypothetical protein
VAFCERDRFCQQVLAKHWPEVPIFDDICTLTAESVSDAWVLSLSDYERQVITTAAKRKDYDGAVQMYDAGFSVGDCANYYSISRQSMWQILKSRGVAMRSNLKYGDENHFYRGGSTADERAHNLVEKAIASGKLVPQPYDDYNHPLKVRWLCQKCHHEWHKHNRAIQIRGEVVNSESERTEQSILRRGVDVITGGFP